MATVRIEFKTDNAAFEDAWESEVAYVLGDAIATLQAFAFAKSVDKRLRDSNGNTIGKVEVME